MVYLQQKMTHFLGELTFSIIDELQNGLHSLPFFSHHWWATGNLLYWLFVFLSLCHSFSLPLCWTSSFPFGILSDRLASLPPIKLFHCQKHRGWKREGVQGLTNTALMKAFVMRLELGYGKDYKCLNHFQFHLKMAITIYITVFN